MNTTQNILTNLEERRQELGMSLRILAHRSDLGVATVQRALRGRTGEKFSTVVAIADALGAEVGLVRQRQISACRKSQAKAKAKKLVGVAQGSAALENRAVGPETLLRIQREAAKELLTGSSHRLWD